MSDASPVQNLTCDSPNGGDAELVTSWAEPSGNYNEFHFNVSQKDVSKRTEIIKMTNTCNQSCSQTISNLSYYTDYELTVRTHSCGRPSTPVVLSCRTGITGRRSSHDHNIVTELDLHVLYVISIYQILLFCSSANSR